MSDTEQTPVEATEGPQEALEGSEGTRVPEDAENASEAPQKAGEEDVFPRSYVEELRRESATYRTKAAKAEDLADALWTSRVEALGALADPTDLPRPEDADALDPEAVQEAVKELLKRKPHLASRVPRGDVGQGYVAPSEPVSLLGMLRTNAG